MLKSFQTLSPGVVASRLRGSDDKPSTLGHNVFMEITLKRKGQNYTCYYDEIDENIVDRYNWNISKGGYAVSKTKNYRVKNHIRVGVLMHRLILGLTNPEICVDHINQNPLDNRRCNIRACSRKENAMNKKPKGWSKYLGVTFCRVGNKKIPKAQIKANGRLIYLGCFKTEKQAAVAYDIQARKYFGSFANLNFKK